MTTTLGASRSTFLCSPEDAVQQGAGLVCSDCRKILPVLEPDSVALTHTSPPYNIGRKYASFRDQQDIDQYLELVKDVLEQLFRVTRPNGSVFWQVGYTNFGKGSNGSSGGIVPLDSLTIPIARSIGFIIWDRIIWNYYGSMAFRAKFTNRYETILWLVKPSDDAATVPLFNLDAIRERSKSYDGRNHLFGRNPGNVWYAERVAFGSTGQTSHVAVFPEEVSEKIVRACSEPGDLLLDPFAGSGTLPKVAATLGRRFVAAELSEAYAREADERLRLWGMNEIENLAIGLVVKYGFHNRPGLKGLGQLARLLESHLLAPGQSDEHCALRESIDEILDATRVTKRVKQKKQDLWMRYDKIIDTGDEAYEVVAADRALCFCYAHRRKWNGLRRFVTATDLLLKLRDDIGGAGGAEAFIKTVCAHANARLRLRGRRVECVSPDPGLGCNGDPASGRRPNSAQDDNLSLWP